MDQPWEVPGQLIFSVTPYWTSELPNHASPYD